MFCVYPESGNFPWYARLYQAYYLMKLALFSRDGAEFSTLLRWHAYDITEANQSAESWEPCDVMADAICPICYENGRIERVPCQDCVNAL